MSLSLLPYLKTLAAGKANCMEEMWSKTKASTILTAMYDEKLQILARIMPLDAERFKKGDLPLECLIAKCCSYNMTE